MNFKKFLSLLLIFALGICCMFLFASCDEPTPDEPDNGDTEGDTPNPGSFTYKVAVKDKNGAPVAGAVCYFTINGKESNDLTTDETGVLELENSQEAMVAMVTIVSVPTGYILPDEDTIVYDPDVSSVEFILGTQDKYTVKVVDEEGNGVKDVYVQLCFDLCLTPAYTNIAGVCEFLYNSDITPYVTLKLDRVNGYTCDESLYNAEKGGYVIYFEPNKTELQIVLTSAN